MKKEVTVVLLGMFLLSLIAVDAQEWVGTDSEFITASDENLTPISQVDRIFDFFDINFLFWTLGVVVVLLIYFHLRKINKGKVSVKVKRKKK